MLYANSITLTPGTVSIRVHGTKITVHAIADEVADDLLEGEMDRRVTRLEGENEVTGVFAAATAAIVVCMGLTLIRSIAGPTVFDRILAVNSFGTKTVLLIALIGYLSGRPDFLDLALVYALMNFIGTIAAMKFTRFGDLAGMEEEDSEEVY